MNILQRLIAIFSLVAEIYLELSYKYTDFIVIVLKYMIEYNKWDETTLVINVD